MTFVTMVMFSLEHPCIGSNFQDGGFSNMNRIDGEASTLVTYFLCITSVLFYVLLNNENFNTE